MMRPWRLLAIMLCPLSLALAVSHDAHAQAGKKPDPKAQPPAQTPFKKGGGKLDPKMAEAKRLFDEGAKAYGEGSYEAAIESWEMSYDISKRDLICESIANAYERLGQPKKAHEYLSRWRAAAPPEERDTLDARLKNLEERIAREDEAERKSKEERERREKDQKVVTPTPEPGTPISVPGIVLAGVGVAAVVTGVVLDIVASKSRPDEATACRPVDSRQICLASQKDAIEGSNRQAFVGDVLWIAGSVSAAAGGVLLVTKVLSAKKQSTEPAPAPAAAMVVPLVLPSGGGVAVHATF